MTDIFSRAIDNVDKLQEDIIGPDYNYTKQIKSPQEMGMSSKGNITTISKNISGLVGYTQLLVTGSGNASKTGRPLGDKFFLETGANCKDKASGNLVTRSIYVDNVPDGSIPFITQGLGGAKFTSFRGLVPGTMSNLNKLNPFQIVRAFMAGTNPPCRAVTMPTIDNNNRVGKETRYVSDVDIKSMDPCMFSSDRNPITREKCNRPPSSRRESRKEKRASRRNARKNKRKSRRNARKNKRKSKRNARKNKRKSRRANRRGRRRRRREGFEIEDYYDIPEDIFTIIYYNALGLLGLYILFKLYEKKRK